MSYCSASCTSVRSPLIAAIATFALKADVWFRRGLLLMLSPDSRANLVRCQAEAPLIALCRFPKPALLARGHANGDAVVRWHLRRQLRWRDASKAPPVHTPVPAMRRPSCVMGCRSHERTHQQARALRHLYAQIDRVQSRACLQLARRPTRGLRGIYKEPSARRLAADPRPLRRRRILRRLARPPCAAAALGRCPGGQD